MDQSAPPKAVGDAQGSSDVVTYVELTRVPSVSSSVPQTATAFSAGSVLAEVRQMQQRPAAAPLPSLASLVSLGVSITRIVAPAKASSPTKIPVSPLTIPSPTQRPGVPYGLQASAVPGIALDPRVAAVAIPVSPSVVLRRAPPFVMAGQAPQQPQHPAQTAVPAIVPMSTVAAAPQTPIAPTVPKAAVTAVVPKVTKPRRTPSRKRKTTDDDDDDDDDAAYGDDVDIKDEEDESPARKKHVPGEALVLSMPASGLTLAETEVAVIVKECKAKIGEGRFSLVFSVHTTQGPVAVKLWRKQRRLSEEDLGNLKNEADAIRDCQSANVVRFIGYCAESPCICTISELCELGTLMQFVEKREKTALICAKRFATELENALRFVHGRGYIHRDVKPENCFIKADEKSFQLKLGDFGHATRKGKSEKSARGTDSWAAPELDSGERATTKSDTYSYGLVLLFILNGHQHDAGRLQFRKEWDPRWTNLVKACCNVDPTKRPTHDIILSLIAGLPEHPVTRAARVAAAVHQEVPLQPYPPAPVFIPPPPQPPTQALPVVSTAEVPQFAQQPQQKLLVQQDPQ